MPINVIFRLQRGYISYAVEMLQQEVISCSVTELFLIAILRFCQKVIPFFV